MTLDTRDVNMKQKQAAAGQGPAAWTKRSDHPLKNIPSDVLLKARSTLVSIGDALKSRPPPEEQQTPAKTKTKHNTLDYFRKQKTPKAKPTLHTSKSDPSFRNTDDPSHRQRSQSTARKAAMGVESPDRTRKSRPLSSDMFDRELTKRYDPYEESLQFLHSRLVLPIQGDGMHSDYSETFDKPRKKLSFREPEIDVFSESSKSATLGRKGKHSGTNSVMRPQNSKFVDEGIASSCENMDNELENQAMRIVRTVGQAFEVCHKLSLNSPTGDDAASATTSDKQEEAISEAAASTSVEAPTRPRQLDLPPPVEIRASPARTLADAAATADSTPLPPLEELFLAPPAPPPGLGAQHEARLLREHVEQQAQQTRAAVAQLRLLRDQLTAERAARCEAQARTHQLLVQNKEMLDHISSLVAHLQERECGASSHTPISVQHLTMVPQTPSTSIPAFSPDFSDAALSIDSSPVLGNRSVLNNTSFLDNFASFLPQSPVKIPLTPSDNNNSMSFNIPNAHGATGAINKQTNKSFTFNMNCNDQSLYQKLQTLGGLPNGGDYKNANGQSYQQMTNNFSNMILNDAQTLSKPNQVFQYPGNMTNSNSVQQMSILTPSPSQSMSSQYTPMTGSKDFLCEDPFGSDDGMQFIRPLSQVDTLTTFDHEGRVRIIVPVTPNGSSSNMTDLSERREAIDNADLENDNVSMVTLKVTDESGNIIRRGLPNSPPFITRTTSEKVPNRSEMMNNMRLQWTRHTTK